MKLHNFSFLLAMMGMLFISLFTSGIVACKCRNDDWSVAWDESFKCCTPAATGVWIAKDCKGAVDAWVFTKCCKKQFKKQSDCRHFEA